MSISQTVNTMNKKVSQSSNQALRNPWVLSIIGIMVVFVTVNVIFIIVAFISSPGLVVEDYYEQGRTYEKNALKMLAATQNTRAWETKLDMNSDARVNQENNIRFTVVDERGLPVQHANAHLVAYRPSDAKQDIKASMHEIAPGLFETAIAFPLKGVWDVNVKIQQENNKFELVKRITVKQ